jgi:hypothetical protein
LPSLRDRWRSPKLIAAWCAAYVLLGGVALGYSTRLSLAGNDFWALYGDDSRRSTYCAADDECARARNPTVVDWDVVRLLRTFR